MERELEERELKQTTQARLLQRERAARKKAEAAQKRLAFLSEASHTLGSSLDYETTLNVVAKLAVPAIADWCAVDLLDERDSLQRVAVVHSDPEKVRLAYELRERSDPDPDAPYGIRHVLHSGEPELIAEIPDSLLHGMVQDEGVRSLLDELGLHSYMAVPMKTHEKTIGVITFVTAESRRRFTSDDLELAHELARRGALAVQNARLFRQVQELNDELEERVRRRTAELEATNRELEAFSYSVSHDLRAPLRAIDGFSQALQEDYLDEFDDTGRHFLRRIRAGAQQMGRLIDDLLQLSRLSRHQMQRERVHLSALASAIAASLQETDTQRDVSFEIDDAIVAPGDPHLLKIALENLLDNAWKFTGGQKQAVIKFGRQDDGADGEVYFVGDNGVGFDMAYADKLFGAFQRLHSSNEFPGTGIGLATVQRIIHRHGGRIWAEADVDDGATFYFTLGKGEGREKDEHPAGGRQPG